MDVENVMEVIKRDCFISYEQKDGIQKVKINASILHVMEAVCELINYTVNNEDDSSNRYAFLMTIIKECEVMLPTREGKSDNDEI